MGILSLKMLRTFCLNWVKQYQLKIYFYFLGICFAYKSLKFINSFLHLMKLCVIFSFMTTLWHILKVTTVNKLFFLIKKKITTYYNYYQILKHILGKDSQKEVCLLYCFLHFKVDGNYLRCDDRPGIGFTIPEVWNRVYNPVLILFSYEGAGPLVSYFEKTTGK